MWWWWWGERYPEAAHLFSIYIVSLLPGVRGGDEDIWTTTDANRVPGLRKTTLCDFFMRGYCVRGVALRSCRARTGTLCEKLHHA